MASKTLRGNTCSINFARENSLPLFIRSFTPSASVFPRLTPTPGLVILTSTSPRKRLINEADTNQSMAFPPTLPTVFRSPSLAIPTTRVAKTSGAMIIWTRRRKITVSSLILGPKSLMNSGEAFLFIKYPTMIPSIIESIIYKVRRLFFDMVSWCWANECRKSVKIPISETFGTPIIHP